MKVLNLRCANGHGFEGWFGSDDDYMSQNGRALIECPLCADKIITRMPSAPRLNLSGARDGPREAGREGGPAGGREVARVTQPAPAQSAAAPALAVQHVDLQAAWLQSVRKLMASTEDVGRRFAEEARRIHYGEKPHRGIRGQATPEEREALQDEGIETMSIPVPRALEGPIQ